MRRDRFGRIPSSSQLWGKGSAVRSRSTGAEDTFSRGLLTTRAVFRDITQMGYGGCDTGTGYDLATGIGSPKAATLATEIP